MTLSTNVGYHLSNEVSWKGISRVCDEGVESRIDLLDGGGKLFSCPLAMVESIEQPRTHAIGCLEHDSLGGTVNRVMGWSLEPMFHALDLQTNAIRPRVRRRSLPACVLSSA
jgi:hypothetical protein